MRTRAQSRRRRQQQTPPAVVENFDLEEPIVDQNIVAIADNRTMAQMLQAPIEGYEDAIAPTPQIQGVSKTDFENYVKANDAVLKNVQNQGSIFQAVVLPLCSTPDVSTSLKEPEQNTETSTEKIGYERMLSVEMPKFNKWLSSLLRNKEKLEEIAIHDTWLRKCYANHYDNVHEKLKIRENFLSHLLSASVTLNSLGNEDKVFKPGILVYHTIHDKNLVTLEENLKENISSGTLLVFKEPSFLLLPPEPPDKCLNFEPILLMKNAVLNEAFYQSNVEDVNSFTIIIWIFLPYFPYTKKSPLIFSFRSENFVFDPGIFA
ncbi:hypothetical protein Tco_1155986 [Tanacetum coccineum]